MSRPAAILFFAGLLVAGIGLTAALRSGGQRSPGPDSAAVTSKAAAYKATGAAGVRSDNSPARSAHDNAQAAHNSKEARLRSILEWSRRADKTAVRKLLSALEESDPEIRSEALEALIQAGDRAVADDLRSLAEKVADPEFKAKLLEAADYIALPGFKSDRIPGPPGDAVGEDNRPR
jgi:HEAT repeat protein